MRWTRVLVWLPFCAACAGDVAGTHGDAAALDAASTPDAPASDASDAAWTADAPARDALDAASPSDGAARDAVMAVDAPVDGAAPDAPVIVENAYYVSTAGNDLDLGTAAAPWRTIQKAADTLVAGDTVYIRGGTYNESVVVGNSGTSSGYITFSNYPGETVVIDGAGVAIDYFAPLVSVGAQSYIKIRGLRVINSGGQGIGDSNGGVANGYIIVEGCSTYRTQLSGIHFYNAHHVIVDAVEVDTANLTADQESVSFANVDTFEIRNCTVVRAQKEGIDAKAGCSNGKIYNNVVRDPDLSYPYSTSIYIDASATFCHDIEVSNNTVVNGRHGVVVASEGGGTVTNVNIHHNTVTNCLVGFIVAGWGWDDSFTHPMDGVVIDHNTASSITDIGIELQNPDARNTVVTNNTITGADVPIYAIDEALANTTIDGNAFDRIVSGCPNCPTGTNYTLLP